MQVHKCAPTSDQWMCLYYNWNFLKYVKAIDQIGSNQNFEAQKQVKKHSPCSVQFAEGSGDIMYSTRVAWGSGLRRFNSPKIYDPSTIGY